MLIKQSGTKGKKENMKVKEGDVTYFTEDCKRGLRGYAVFKFSSVQSLSRVRLCNPMNRSMPGLPVHRQLPEFTQTHAH